MLKTAAINNITVINPTNISTCEKTTIHDTFKTFSSFNAVNAAVIDNNHLVNLTKNTPRHSAI